MLGHDPGIHRGDELVASDEVHLQRQDAKQQIAISGRSGHRVVTTADNLGEKRGWPYKIANDRRRL
jgi:hypothetical protein